MQTALDGGGEAGNQRAVEPVRLRPRRERVENAPRALKRVARRWAREGAFAVFEAAGSFDRQTRARTAW